MDTVTCPACGGGNAFFVTMGSQGAIFECPDCDNEWTDESFEVDDDEE